MTAPDENQMAHRLVEQATGDGMDCHRCGAQMEKVPEHEPIGGFGSEGPVAERVSSFYRCPKCGADTRG